MMKIAKILLTALIVLRVFVAAANQTYTVSTLASWNGTSVFGQMGEDPSVPGTVTTFGQTFTAPTNYTTLQSFSFYMEDSPVFNPDPLNFGTYIMAWNGNRAVGPVLWRGGETNTAGLAHAQFRRYDYTNINLSLTPGSNYVFIVSASEYFDGVVSEANIGGLAANVYPGGGLVTMSNGSNFSMLTNADWQTSGLIWDWVFEAQFGTTQVTNIDISLYTGIRFTGPVGSTYAIQYATALNKTNWTTLTNVTLQTPQFLYIDTNSINSGPHRFYRVLPTP